MSENIYTIKEASKLVEVETHVLRYWEDELDMKIKRNELGHRYYEEQDINILKKVKELKDRGIQLKAIREVTKKMYQILEGESVESVLAQTAGATCAESAPSTSGDVAYRLLEGDDRIVDFKMAQFQNMLSKMIGTSMKEAIKPLGVSITEDTVKQIDLLMQERDQREEERFRRIDAAIRQMQDARKEIAAAEMNLSKRARRKLRKNNL